MDWLSLLLPAGYLTSLILSLAVFSHLYRRRKAIQASRLQPWFPEHVARNVYLTLLEQASTSISGDSKSPKVPDSVLRAALLQRCVTNIGRLMALRTQKPALMQLLQRGAVGDELMQRFTLAEKEMEAELKDCVAEASALAGPGSCGVQGQPWGQTIFTSAGEMVNQEGLREKLKDIEDQRSTERQNWTKRRGEVREGFLKELEGESAAFSPKGVTREARPDSSGKTQGSSDSDTVLVDKDTSADGDADDERRGSVASSGDSSNVGTTTTATGSGGGGGGGGGKKKKKKGGKK